ncbi:MAG: nitroreductase family protein [Desulfobacteraceae bacterium]
MIDLIRTRRSIRSFTPEAVEEALLDRVLEAGTWAPSGLNNQPWKFVVVRGSNVRDELGGQTKYGTIIRQAPVAVAVFLDHRDSYDRTKDVQAIGACIQNMLLAAHGLGLGAVWLGEILKNRREVERILGVPGECELMAVVALGHPAQTKRRGSRKLLDEVVLARK